MVFHLLPEISLEMCTTALEKVMVIIKFLLGVLPPVSI